jgi:hypothetical protein
MLDFHADHLTCISLATDFELQGEYAFGDICWDASAQKWTWQILPDYPLSRLNIHK